jgi:hypothetical protein
MGKRVARIELDGAPELLFAGIKIPIAKNLIEGQRAVRLGKGVINLNGFFDAAIARLYASFSGIKEYSRSRLYVSARPT